MDDPWGSPWAIADSAPKNDSSSLPSNDLLSPPPRAFIGSWSNLSNQSFWANEDSAGVWAGGDQTDSPVPSPGWEVWSGTGSASQSHQLTPRADTPRKASSIAWPSPGLAPVDPRRSSSLLRHPSPDPWASEPSWRSTRSVSPAKSQAEEPRSKEEKKNSLNVTSGEKPGLDHAPPDPDSEREVDQVHRLEQEDQTTRGRASLKPGQAEVSRSAETPTKSTAELKPQEHRSRPSSSFSDDSGVSLDLQDSPITSIDEDLKPQSEEQPAGPSPAAVSEAGSVCDTPVHATAQGTREQEAHPKDAAAEVNHDVQDTSVEEKGSDDEDDDDFGDFEAPSPVDIRAEDVPPTAVKADRRSLDTHAPSVAVQRLVEKFGPIHFELNLQAIDQLFPKMSDHTKPEGRGDSNVSDKIITDSFSTVDERKTWYRISRYGSMRKHDSGQDENYHGVTWKSSQLHDDVIKIVRRWMEEDSFAGKPNLGGAKRENVFNWDSDSSTAPISLKDVFARRKSVTHARTNSLPSSTQNAGAFASSFSKISGNRRTFGGSIDVPNGATASIRSPLANAPLASAPIATFDWSSKFVDSPSRSSVSSGSGNQGVILSPPTPKPLGKDLAPAAPPSDIKPKNALHISLPPKQAEQFDGDDDWGEMVSSPVPGPPQGTVGKSAITQISTEVARMHNRSISQPQAAFKWPEVLTPRSPKKFDNIVSSPNKTNAMKSNPSINGHRYTQSLSKPPATSRSISPLDPWASAGFSIFDKPIATPVLSPVLAKSPAATESVQVLSMDSPRSSASTYQKATVPPVPKAKVVLGPIASHAKEREEDEFVQHIIQNLPDLSYMLR